MDGSISATAADNGLQWLDGHRCPADFNGPTGRTFTPLGAEALECPIINHLERIACAQPERTAVSDSDISLSFAQLWDGVTGLAESISARSGAGELVGILLPACAMYPLAMLACLAAGRPFVALDTSHPGEWLSRVLGDARPPLLITDRDTSAAISTAVSVILLSLTRPPQRAKPGWRPVVLPVDAPACVLFTSGSTGAPKGILNSQRSLLRRAIQSINAAHINATDRFLSLAPHCTIVVVRDVITALLAGASIHILDPQFMGGRRLLSVIRSQAVTILFAVPALLRSTMPQAAERAGPALRLVRVGGDATLWSDIEGLRAWLAPGTAIESIYAATEAPIMQWFVSESCRDSDPRIPIGYPLEGNSLAVIDESGRCTPAGKVGELVVASPYVALGRWTKGGCVVDAADSDGRRLFYTGDLVRVRHDGLLERHGRKDRQVKIRGFRVEPEAVEALIRQHPGVRDVGVLARTTSPHGDAILVAYVSPVRGTDARLLDELRAMMRSAPAPMRPTRFYMAREITRLPGSKLDVRALQALDRVNVSRECASSGEAIVFDSHVDHVAKTVAHLWRDALRIPLGGPDEDFFEAGGDSLTAIAFALQLERALGLELPLTVINKTPQFSRLCAALRSCPPARYTPLVLLKAGSDCSPLFFVHGAGGNVAELFSLARNLSYRGPVYGVQPRGLDRRWEMPHTTVEAMATEYLKAIRAQQPHGPYYLCGYSFGGLVAFEMAVRLRESGDHVDLVGLFDTMPSAFAWPLRLWLAFVGRRLQRLAVSPSRWPGAVLNAGRSFGARLRDPSLRSVTLRTLKVAISALLAAARYRPGFYAGELQLFSPAERDQARPQLRAVWQKHAAALSDVDTEGDHLTMISMLNAVSTATALMRCLPVGSRQAMSTADMGQSPG
jgi:non-ribosomal peptide synthetase component F/thioesterase domain-containing protein